MLHYDQKSKELQEFEARYELKNAILSKILIKNLSPEEHSIIINRGSRDGIEKNMAAIYKFQLLGRVQEVFSTHSKVILISDSHSNVSAYTNTSNARGIVKGTNTINKCQLHYISHLKAVHNGDLILSSGQGLIFPEGFCLGKIINIKTHDICHHVEVEPLVDFSAIEMCHVTNQSKMNLF
jgi:rod shape-determining protein MreC